MDLSGWMNQTITAQRQTGSSSYGDPTWANARTLAARVEPSSKRIVGPDGSVIFTTHRVFTREALSTLDRVWLPGSNTSKTIEARRPAAIVAVPDKGGVTSHYETSF